MLSPFESLRVTLDLFIQHKSPGPDGFTLEFFKRFWIVVKEDVLLFVHDFYERARLIKACNSAFITLVPKINNPQSLNEYRPICLVGSLYKILAKLLANRLKKMIGNLVSQNQSAFIEGRNILDGALVVNEVMDLAKREKRSCVVLKVDFEKAYDRVSWNFVRYIFKRMGVIPQNLPTYFSRKLQSENYGSHIIMDFYFNKYPDI